MSGTGVHHDSGDAVDGHHYAVDWVLLFLHGIKAPATSGHPQFERAYRVQLNTLEQMGIFLPFLWVAAFYPIGWAWLAPLIGFVWLIGRILYLRGYMTDPNKRITGAMMGGVTSLIMFIIAATGVVQACLALRVM